MSSYLVTLTMRVQAEIYEDAVEVAEGAAEHLMETFNDDESLESVKVTGCVKAP